MGTTTDGTGKLSAEEQSKSHRVIKKFACAGVLTSSGLRQSVCQPPFTPAHAISHGHSACASIRHCLFSPRPSQNRKKKECKIHYRGSAIIGGGGASQALQGKSQSAGAHVPAKNRRQKLARCCAHGECYLLVIVVVILCPVWQCINEQHANTFCPNICDRHIFRQPSKKTKKARRNKLSLAAWLSSSAVILWAY